MGTTYATDTELRRGLRLQAMRMDQFPVAWMLTETDVAAIAAPWLDPVSAVLLSDRTVFVSGAGSGRGSREWWQYRPMRHGSPTMPAPAYAADHPYRLNGALLDGTLAVCSAHEAE